MREIAINHLKIIKIYIYSSEFSFEEAYVLCTLPGYEFTLYLL